MKTLIVGRFARYDQGDTALHVDQRCTKGDPDQECCRLHQGNMPLGQGNSLSDQQVWQVWNVAK